MTGVKGSTTRWQVPSSLGLFLRVLTLVSILVLSCVTSGRADTNVGSVVTLEDGMPSCTVSATSAEVVLVNTVEGSSRSVGAVSPDSIRIEIEARSSRRDGEMCMVWVGVGTSRHRGEATPNITRVAWASVSPSAIGTNPYSVRSGNTLLVEMRLSQAAADGIRSGDSSMAVLLSSDRASG